MSFREIAMKISRVLHLTVASCILAAGISLVPGPTAFAQTVQNGIEMCSFIPEYNGHTATVSSVTCTGGASAYPIISYYISDNTTRVTTVNGQKVKTGTSSISRPASSFENSGGFGVSW